MADTIKQRRHVTLGDVARAINGKLTGEAEAEALDVTHDSRQARAGSLFAAVRGGTSSQMSSINAAAGTDSPARHNSAASNSR